MKKQLKVESLKLKVNERNFLFFSIVLLVTFYLSLVTVVDADDVQSRAAVVMEASTGRILYAKNPNLRLLPASTTKLMTAIIALEETNLSDVVKISKNASLAAPLRSGFKEGDEVTIETLLYAALLKSANDAAVALAEAVAGSEEKFVYLMNRKAATMGLMDTKFINPNGLPGPDQYTTAFDLSTIMRSALRYPKLKEIIGTRVAEVSAEKGKNLFLRNTNKLLWSDENLIGGKTGYTRKARHCFVCAAEREDGAVIVALLGSPSRVNLWEETETLINKGLNILANKEDSVVYFTKADYDALNVKKASYRKNSESYVKTTKFKTKNKLARKKGKTKAFVKKRGNAKTLAKSKKLKDYRALKKTENGNTG